MITVEQVRALTAGNEKVSKYFKLNHAKILKRFADMEKKRGSEMTEREINKTIAEYMGYTVLGNAIHWQDGDDFRSGPLGDKYTTSLDALVPVWEKMNLPRILEIDISGKGRPNFSYRYFTQLSYSHSAMGDTIQLAAAKATAQEIKELR